jgi:hypothetical protein
LKTTVALRTLYALCSAAWKYWSPNMMGISLKERETLIATSRYSILKELYDRWEETQGFESDLHAAGPGIVFTERPG